MGKHRYLKPEPPSERGLCVKCNIRLQKKVSSKNVYRAICSTCDKELYQKTKRVQKYKPRYRMYTLPRLYENYTIYKKDCCEKCGFIPEDRCQLDVDHIDGDHTNNALHNLQTLCANCHRLKTRQNKEGIYKPR